MVPQSFKERVTQVAIAQAKVYEQVFLKYEYLICSEAFSENPYYIISAHADNFRHLVGVNTSFSAEDFFNKCLDGSLEEDDFDFLKRGQSEKEVKGAVRDKIIALPDFLTMIGKPLIAQESFVKNRVHCSFATTDRSATIGFIAEDKSKPMTLLRGDRLDATKSAAVDLILCRPYGSEKFTEVVYGNKDMVKKYIDAIKSMLAEELIPEESLQPVML